MPAVFVHGVPDTPALWDRVTAALGRDDCVCLRLPGFGSARPAGFAASKEAYADWLLRELRGIDGPVDIVGHDWGGVLVLRALTLAPDCARSWAVGAAPLDPDYRWHSLARRWQTPLLGELIMAGFTPGRMRRALMDARVPAEYAHRAAAAIDGDMKRSVLALYRSAKRVGTEWSPAPGQIRAPGLVLWGALDPYVATRYGEALARRTGAEFVRFDDCGHWWPCERPEEVAARLEAHWAALGGGEDP